MTNPTQPGGAAPPRPLEDVTVVDLTIALAGPFATLLLAGLGARVIKVENPREGDRCRHNAPYLGRDGATLTRQHDDDLSINAINRLRGKLGVTLNLKHPEGREVFLDLVRRADIVVENFSRGVMDRLGVGYAEVRAINPRVVFCSITGFGSDGDPSTGKAMDTIIQAASGMMHVSGGAGDPPIRVGFPVADLGAPLFGVIGILAALHQARRTGVGQHVDVSMLGVTTSLLADEPFDVLERCGVPFRTGNTVPRLAPFGVYPASDGHLAICAPTEGFAQGLFVAMGRPELGREDRFRNRDQRVRHVKELDALIVAWTSSLTVAEALARLDEAGVPSSEVRTPSAAVRDPRVLERREIVPLAHPTYGVVEDVYGMGLPIRFSGATSGYDQPPPALGQHNEAVYRDMLGYSPTRLDDLRARGVV